MQRQIQNYQAISDALEDGQLAVLEGYQPIYSKSNPFLMFCLPVFFTELTDHNKWETHSLNTGWKAHLSCHVDDIAALWDLVVPFLQKHHCAAFKCISHSGFKNFQNKTVHGVSKNQFTIYMQPNEVIHYKTILAELEILLGQHNIRPVLSAKNSVYSSPELIIGKYTSVRHAGYGEPLKYISIENAFDKFIELSKNNIEVKAYNLSNAFHPFDPVKEVIKPIVLSPIQRKLMLLREKDKQGTESNQSNNKENIQLNTPK